VIESNPKPNSGRQRSANLVELNMLIEISDNGLISSYTNNMHLMPAIRQTPSRLQHHSSRPAV
jgi:hypothetical protein